MPTPLPTVDLSAAVVGTTGAIDLTPVAPTSNPAYTQQSAILQLYNESGCGLRLSYRDTLGGTDLPAGGWKDLTLPLGEGQIIYSVLYVLPNAGVSKLLPTYYLPSESVPHGGTLGNSPVNLGNGTVASEVLQFGATAPNIVLQASPQGSAAAAILKSQINNDGSTFFGNTSIVGSQFSTDTGGNAAAHQITLTKPPILATGNQESGHFFWQFVAPSVVVWSFFVSYKTVMTNTPTISFSGSTLVNCTVIPTHITKFGFNVDITPSGAGTTSFDTDWVTVGN